MIQTGSYPFRLGIGEFFEEVSRETLTPRDLQLVRGFHALDRGAQQEIESLILHRDGRGERRARLERGVS